MVETDLAVFIRGNVRTGAPHPRSGAMVCPVSTRKRFLKSRREEVNIEEKKFQRRWNKADDRISLTGCFCVTLANKLGAAVVAADRQGLGVLANTRICKVRFIR